MKAQKKSSKPLKKLRPYWTTAGGARIPYKELENAHLKNIIKDGYRNENILKEAKRRGFRVPERLVDKLTPLEFAQWLESIASTALAGSESAMYMWQLWKEKEYALFMLELEGLLQLKKRDDRLSTGKTKVRRKARG